MLTPSRVCNKNRQSLQTSAGILKHYIAYLLEILTKHSSLFQRLAIRPSTTYPGRTQENVLMTLLRKKLEPDIETLVEAARDEALAAGISPTKSFISQEGLLAQREREKAERRQAKFGFGMAGGEGEDSSEEEDEGSEGSSGDEDDDGGERVREPVPLGDVWVDSMAWCRERLKRFAHEFEESLYTAEERAMGIENVRTGLKRSLEEEEESEEEESDEEEGQDGEGDTAMGGVMPAASGLGQLAGQNGMGGGAGGGEAEDDEEARKRLAMDELRMLGLVVRGE